MFSQTLLKTICGPIFGGFGLALHTGAEKATVDLWKWRRKNVPIMRVKVCFSRCFLVFFNFLTEPTSINRRNLWHDFAVRPLLLSEYHQFLISLVFFFVYLNDCSVLAFVCGVIICAMGIIGLIGFVVFVVGVAYIYNKRLSSLFSYV